MGNNPSKPAGGVASPPVTAASNHNSHQSQSQNHSSPNHARREPRRRESIQGLPAGKTQPAHPSESITSATAQPTQSSSQKPQLHHHLHSSSPSSNHRSHREDKMGNEQSREKWREKDVDGARLEKTQSNPVKVPKASDSRRQKGPDSQFEPSGPPRDPNYIPHSNLNFPPRLPLPIEEEIHTPGSPIITPADFSTALRVEDVDGVLPSRNSVLSSTTLDEDELSNDFQPYPADGSRRTVPTLVQWKQGGDKVYVTGTFASWSRKYRMYREVDTDILSATLELPPGTHHVKFIVDGEMQLSNELPTAVDYTNILVNYIEVSADDLPRGYSAEEKAAEGLHPPQVLPSGTKAKDHAVNAANRNQPAADGQATEPIWWGDEVPQYLQDLDRPEESRRYQRASGAIVEIPTPPSLPLFLGKSILNGTTPMKDDSSVLNMPNHTVLNHLATSSIKSGVLATSVTTRYKRKYVTTIMHKPTSEGD